MQWTSSSGSLLISLVTQTSWRSTVSGWWTGPRRPPRSPPRRVEQLDEVRRIQTERVRGLRRVRVVGVVEAGHDDGWIVILSATSRMRAVSPTEVPPYFCTTTNEPHALVLNQRLGEPRLNAENPEGIPGRSVPRGLCRATRPRVDLLKLADVPASPTGLSGPALCGDRCPARACRRRPGGPRPMRGLPRCRGRGCPRSAASAWFR